eukprot:scaffold293_cov135-Cylindrotheca_fusiformis.AAC.1
MSENRRRDIIVSMVVDCCRWDDRTKAMLHSGLHARLSQRQILDSSILDCANAIGGSGKGTTAPCSIVNGSIQVDLTDHFAPIVPGRL